jgi:amidase
MHPPERPAFSRRSLLKGTVAVGLLWGLSPQLAGCSPGRTWTDSDLTTLQQELERGSLTATELLRQTKARIEELNPALAAVIELNPEAEQLAASPRPGPLSGLPVLLKDNIGTADRMSTAAGSAALAQSRYPKDAVVVERLRASGAVLVGKANMSEWSNLRSRNSTSGWSARGGQCRNPHDLSRSPSGSSSGSAAAVAAGLVPLALGTEMLGSITCPASACGVVGLKPTLGLVPTAGIIPCAHSLDCAGPLTRTVADAALALEILAGSKIDYRSALARGALRGARIGVARQEWGFDWRVDQLMEENLKTLSLLGAQIIDPVTVPRLWDVIADFSVVWKTEFKHGVNHYLAAQAPDIQIRSLAQVIEFNRSHSDLEALGFMDQQLLEDAEKSAGIQDQGYLKALERMRKASGRERLEKVFAEHKLSAIVAPTLGVPWTIDFVNGDHFEGSGASPAALAGCPHITVPGGQVQGLPVGLSLYGPSHSEVSLLAMAYDYEQQTHHRVAPKLST